MNRKNKRPQQKINAIPPEADTVKQAFIQNVIFLEAINEGSSVVEKMKTVVVVVSKL